MTEPHSCIFLFLNIIIPKYGNESQYKIAKKTRIKTEKKDKINVVIKMAISWLKSSSDKKSFKVFKNLGMDVYEIKDLEKTDEKIKELVQQKYDTIIISNEVAGFSGDIVKKYAKTENINIIIAPSHNKTDNT